MCLLAAALVKGVCQVSNALKQVRSGFCTRIGKRHAGTALGKPEIATALLHLVTKG